VQYGKEGVMATLVTGGTGFIGSNVLIELAKHGEQVISLDIIPPNDLLQRNLEPWTDRVSWIQGDILDREIMEKVAALGNIEKIVHAATYTPYGDVEKDDIRRVLDINLVGTINMLDLSHQIGVKRFMYLSTGVVYRGVYTPDLPCREDMPLKPYGLYSITKFSCESITQRYGELFGFETVSARLAQNWGPLERVTPYHQRMSIIYDWVGKATRGEPIELSLFGTGIAEVRHLNVDHPYVRDTAAAIRIIMDAPILSHLVFNISDGRPLTLHELTSAIREVFPDVRFVEPNAKTDISKALRRSMDVTRLREDVGFVAQYDILSGIKDYIKWRKAFNFTG